MKTKLAQIVSYIHKFDHRQLQIAYFLVILAAAVITHAPTDGGGGPI